jgi:hypothetical protein
LIQNAGKAAWPANANFHFSCETFAGLQSDQTTLISCLEQVRPAAFVPPGGTFSATLTLEIPSNAPDCFVAPFFDMCKDGTKFTVLGYQEVQEEWPLFFVNLRITGNCQESFAPLVFGLNTILRADESVSP